MESVDFITQRSAAREVAQYVQLTPADRDGFRHTLKQGDPMTFTIGGMMFLIAQYAVACCQAISMQTQEVVSKFLFYIHQRILNEIFALTRAHGDVFKLGLEIHHIDDRH